MFAPDATRLKVFAVVAPGLEQIVATELRSLLPRAVVEVVAGGAELVCGRAELLHLLSMARVPEALRVRIGRFEARTFAELEQGLRKVAWHAWIPRDESVEISVSCAKSRLYHSDAVADRVQAALGDRPETAPATQRVYVRLDHDVVQLSVDASGDLLHRRGWRTHVGAAPLRETLAAACVFATEAHTRGFVDPFCGSGSLVGEALLIAAGVPAARPPWSALRWPSMRAIELLDTPASDLRTGLPRVMAGDLSEREVAATRFNLDSAGVSSACELFLADFEETLAKAPPDMMVLTNPPWGRRLESSRDLHALFRRLGRAISGRTAPVFVLSGWPGFESATRLPWRTALRFPCRGIPVRLLELSR